MKNIRRLLLVVLVIITLTANAQFKFGVTGGLNIAKFSNENISSFENVIGLNSGLIFEVKLPVAIGFEADLLYSMKGSKFKADLGRGIVSSDYSSKYIDLPVVTKLYFFKVLNVQLGLQYSYLIGADLNIDEIGRQDVKDSFNSNDFSAVLGLGFDINRLHFSGRYNWGLVSAFDNGTTKNNQLTFSVGLWLKK